MNYRYSTSSLSHASPKASYVGQNPTVTVLSDHWNKNPWTLWDSPSVLIAIKETENLWLEIKRYQTSVINDQQNPSVAERAFNWFYQCASLSAYLCTRCTHAKCFNAQIPMCVSVDKICESSVWQGYKSPAPHTHWGSGCWGKGPSQRSPWISSDVSSWIPSPGLILIPTHRGGEIR